ncbi:MAG: alpha-glucan family phosphorylase [Candidatus Eisenbacteria bacterium]|nr:alpha-glucan family phosphorylase [Candidatus Eisenbacteria bacterium]
MTGRSMKTIHKYRVRPTLPDRINPLLEIARNLWWTWNPDAAALFARVDRDLWRAVNRNPVALLSRVDQARLNELASDEAFLAHLDRVLDDLRRYTAHPTWYSEVHKESPENRIAYFSAEFGLHECLPIYAGGLGVLAGDHMKSSSELGLPLAGVGLLYRHGYFHQLLGRDGMQTETYEEQHFSGLPTDVVRDAAGRPQLVPIEIGERRVLARIWQVRVGRISLYLLDTDISENEPADRAITQRLYDADPDVRLRQELVLGVGGIRALGLCDVPPTVCHLNEGHSAFLSLERIANLMERHRLGFEEAREIVTASNVFTTHTPVPAGHDAFPPELLLKYVRPYAQRLGIPNEALLDLGRMGIGDRSEPFSMTILALKLSSFHNGVSRLHGSVARATWKGLWPDAPEEEVPITHITNGVHLPSWYSDETARLFDRYLGPDWLEKPIDQKAWSRVATIPDAELWRARERLRTRLVADARRRLNVQLTRRGAHPIAVEEAAEVLDPEALTIGFARRFATYKRAGLLFRDLERLARIVHHSDRPVQFLFAGKAHPKDEPGKEMIRELIRVAELPEFRRQLVFLEDYDIGLARRMVQGVDVWLNTPRRPLEASGTSGMKVAVNGGLNLSILDGWWAEAYNGENGWAIGSEELYDDRQYQDKIDSEALYDLLELVVAPLFYNRGPDGLPRGWIARIKESMRTVCPQFNTNRAAEEYTRRFYIPSLLNWNWLIKDGMQQAREIARWKARLREHWNEIEIASVTTDSDVDLAVGDSLEVRARITLGSLSPEDVKIEVFYGVLTEGEIHFGQGALMNHVGSADGLHEYTGVISCHTSGHFGFSLRATPPSSGLEDSFDRELIAWWNSAGVRAPGVLQQ